MAIKEELVRFIGFVNSFDPALKFTWEISETSVTFLDINISVQVNNLATSVHYKPTDSHSYLLYSSSHPSHVKNSIPYSQFLRLCRLCSDDSDFNSNCDEMSNFFSERGYPDNILSTALNRVQNVTRESALEPSASNNEERISFTLTFHTNNLAANQIQKQYHFSLIRYSSYSNAISILLCNYTCLVHAKGLIVKFKFACINNYMIV